MKGCLVKQPYLSHFIFESAYYPGSAGKLLELFKFRSQGFSLAAESKADFWVIEHENIAVYGRSQKERNGLRSMHRNIVNEAKIPWDNYDFVISLTPIISAATIKKHPRVLWCYRENSHRHLRAQQTIATQRPFGRYDLFLDHKLRSEPRLTELPQGLSFPYLQNPILMRQLIHPLKEPAVFVDSKLVPLKNPGAASREWGILCGLPVKYALFEGRTTEPTRFVTEVISSEFLQTREYLELLGSCKYFLSWRKGRLAGQSALEAATLGLIVIACRNGVYHPLLCHKKCLMREEDASARQGLRIIQKIEANPDLQEEILTHQEEALKGFWDAPLVLLKEAIRRKQNA